MEEDPSSRQRSSDRASKAALFLLFCLNMNNTETEYSKNKPGGTIDSWCGKCKLVLSHTIEAMVGEKPARVHCNTCNAQHTYKPNKPGAAAAARASQPPRPRASRYQSLLKGKDASVTKSYSIKDKYEPGDVMEHPSFGRGVTTAVKDGTKIEVLFEGGSKVLVHGR
jgi:hypothetical protein